MIPRSGGFECLANLHRQCLVNPHRSARNTIGERLAFDQFEDESVRLTAVLDPINFRNVWMVKRGQHLRLARVACDAIRIEGKGVPNNLQRDIAMQLVSRAR